MKILHIINTLEVGGAQSVLMHLLRGWKNNDDHHIVISLRQPGALSPQIEALKIQLEHTNLSPEKFELSSFLKLISIIKAYQPDVIQTWLYHSDLVGGITARLACRAPIVWGVHHTIGNRHSVKQRTWHVIRLLKLISSFLPSQIICCSASAYGTHLDLGYPKDRMVVITNGVDSDQFKADPSAASRLKVELQLQSSVKLIGMFARYHPQKDHQTLIRAAGILIRKNPTVHFVLAGQGVDRSNTGLINLLIREQVLNNFHLIGLRHDMTHLNAAVDIATLSSAYGEALSMALGEAMSCGTPCVATDIGDAASLISHTGRVVQPGNPQALADAWQNILELSDVDYNQLSSQARQRILTFYNLNDMIQSYRSVYQGLNP